jgi:hypothetical protein
MTDHRTEAEKWLATAVRHGDEYSGEPAITAALIGIGHALLAETLLYEGDEQDHIEAQPERVLGDNQASWDRWREVLNGPNVTITNPAAPAPSQRCNARHYGLRCVFWAGHKDPHRATWTEPQ